jgi:nucleoside-diphosphate-sugar epimerase
MSVNTVLVTGGTGFTGGHLCERLVKEGYHVRALVREPEKAQDLQGWGVEIVPGDVRDPQSLQAAVQGVDTVYHIAALFRQGNASRRELWEVNAQGTENMLEAAARAGVRRFIHCSTIGVHGDVKDSPVNEDAPYSPGDEYQETKLEGELIAQRYVKEGRLPVTIFRPAGIYGPRDLRFLKLVKSIQQGTFAMIGSGKTLFHPVYIDDLVDGILLCAEKDQAVGKVYILGGSEIVSLNELVNVIASVLGVRPPFLRVPFTPVYAVSYLCELVCAPLGIDPPLYRRRTAFFHKSRAFDISRAVKELGFKPEVTLREGLECTVQWYEQNGFIRPRNSNSHKEEMLL